MHIPLNLSHDPSLSHLPDTQVVDLQTCNTIPISVCVLCIFSADYRSDWARYIIMTLLFFDGTYTVAEK